MSENTMAVIGVVCTVVGVIFMYIGYRQGANNCVRDDASEHTAVTAKLDYISRGVDDMRLDMKDQGRRMDSLGERVTRVEESSKSAHKRIDELGKEGN